MVCLLEEKIRDFHAETNFKHWLTLRDRSLRMGAVFELPNKRVFSEESASNLSLDDCSADDRLKHFASGAPNALGCLSFFLFSFAVWVSVSVSCTFFLAIAAAGELFFFCEISGG